MNRYKNLPTYWKEKIKNFLATKGEQRNSLKAFDFDPNSTVRLSFEDGSSARFNQAFVLFCHERKEVGIFTEHCGYYVFQSDIVSVQS